MYDEDKLVRELRILAEKRQWIVASREHEGITEEPLAGVYEIEAGYNHE